MIAFSVVLALINNKVYNNAAVLLLVLLNNNMTNLKHIKGMECPAFVVD